MGQLRRYLTLSVLMGAVATTALLMFVTVIAILAVRSSPPSSGVPTAALYVIPAPTYTLPAPTAAPLPTPEPTNAVPPPPPPGVIAVGSYVQVTGTGAVGLRLRSNPGLDSATEFLGIDSEVFKITAGPQEADGYTWWRLESPSDAQRKGWAVANYLIATTANP